MSLVGVEIRATDPQLVVLHEDSSQEDWQPFVEGDVLEESAHNLPGLPVKSLVAPVRVHRLEGHAQTVVVAVEQCVESGQTGLFVHSLVTCHT